MLPIYIYIYMYTLYIPRSGIDVKDSFLENLDDQPGAVYF